MTKREFFFILFVAVFAGSVGMAADVGVDMTVHNLVVTGSCTGCANSTVALGNYIGPVQITANTNNGSDQISNLCVNGTCPVTAFGAKCDGATDDTVAIDTARNAACNNNLNIGGNATVAALQFPRGICLHNGPFIESCPTISSLLVRGEGQFNSIIKNTAIAGFGAIITGNQTVTVEGGRTGLLQPSLASGAGNSLCFGVNCPGGGANGHVLNITEVVPPGTLNGATGLRIKFFIKPNSANNNLVIVSSDGMADLFAPNLGGGTTLPASPSWVKCRGNYAGVDTNIPGCPGAFGVYKDNTGKLAVRVNIGGVIKTLHGTTTLNSGTIYEGEISYNNVTLWLFLNGTIEASTAVTGNIVQGRDEEVILGGISTEYPLGGPGVTGGGITNHWEGQIDSLEIASGAGHISNYTPDTVKFSGAADTQVLLNFDQSATLPTTGPNGAALPIIAPTWLLGSAITPSRTAYMSFINTGIGCGVCAGTYELRDISISSQSGIFADAAAMRVEHVNLPVSSAIYGILATPNGSYYSTIKDINISGGAMPLAMLGGLSDIEDVYAICGGNYNGACMSASGGNTYRHLNFLTADHTQWGIIQHAASSYEHLYFDNENPGLPWPAMILESGGVEVNRSDISASKAPPFRMEGNLNGAGNIKFNVSTIQATPQGTIPFLIDSSGLSSFDGSLVFDNSLFTNIGPVSFNKLPPGMQLMTPATVGTFQPTITSNTTQMRNAQILGAVAGLSSKGIISTTAIGTPNAPIITNVGTPGVTPYTYFVVCRDTNGGKTLPSASGTTATGNASLSTTNYNMITFPTNLDPNCASWDVLKTNTATSLALAVNSSGYEDTGGSTAGYTAPTRDSTGDMSVAGTLVGATTAIGTLGVGDVPAVLATFGTCNAAREGLFATETNSTAACSSGATATNAGTTHCAIRCNGTNWVQTGL